MVIGIVVNVLEEEHQKELSEDPDYVSVEDVYAEVKALRILLE